MNIKVAAFTVCEKSIYMPLHRLQLNHIAAAVVVVVAVAVDHLSPIFLFFFLIIF